MTPIQIGKMRDLTDSGLPIILATALVASLRISEATTASTGTFVNRFRVGICKGSSGCVLGNGWFVVKNQLIDIVGR